MLQACWRGAHHTLSFNEPRRLIAFTCMYLSAPFLHPRPKTTWFLAWSLQAVQGVPAREYRSSTDTIYHGFCSCFLDFSFLSQPREDKEGKKDKEEKKQAMVDQIHDAKLELLQHMQGLSTVLQSAWWTTTKGKQLHRQLEETYRQLAYTMTEESGPFQDSGPNVMTSMPSLSCSREESAEDEEEAAGEMLILDEVTGKANTAHAHSPSGCQCYFFSTSVLGKATA